MVVQLALRWVAATVVLLATRLVEWMVDYLVAVWVGLLEKKMVVHLASMLVEN